MGGGDLIVCNALSYVELLYLGFRYVQTRSSLSPLLISRDRDVLLHSDRRQMWPGVYNRTVPWRRGTALRALALCPI